MRSMYYHFYDADGDQKDGMSQMQKRGDSNERIYKNRLNSHSGGYVIPISIVLFTILHTLWEWSQV